MLTKEFIKQTQELVNDLYYIDKCNRVTVTLVRGNQYFEDYVAIWVHSDNSSKLDHKYVKTIEEVKKFVKEIKEKWM